MTRSHRDVLLSPWLWLAVVVTAVNDQVLKAAHPGWVTGKLSDVTGVAMLALVGAALAGRRWPVVAVGVGFVGLKTVPGVAEAAAPVLGGTTLRDPTDLLALLVLPLVWRWLAVDGRAERPATPWAAGLTAVIQVLAVGAAVVVTSATACVGGTGVSQVSFTDGHFLAVVTDGNASASGEVWESVDGERWTRSDRQAPSPTTTAPSPTTTAPSPTPAVDERRLAQLADGTELTVTPGGVIAVAGDGERTTYRADQVTDGSCANDPAAAYQAIDTDGDVAVVAMGENGVSVRDASGEWSQVAIGDSDPGKTARASIVSIAAGVILFGSFVAWILAIVLASTSPPPRAGIVSLTVVLGFAVGVAQVVSWIVISSGRRQDDLSQPLSIWCVISVATWVGALAIVWSRRRR